MGSLSDDGPCPPMVPHSNGNSTEIVLENGHYTSGIPPKYKKRKVSAIRDFPPGCGRNAPKPDQIPLVSAVRDSPPACRADITQNDQNPPDTEAEASRGDNENLVADVKMVILPEDVSCKASENGNVQLANEIVKCVDKLEVPDVLSNPLETVVPSVERIDVVQVSDTLEPRGDLQNVLDVNAQEPSEELKEVEVITGVTGDGSLDLLETGSAAKATGCMANPSDGMRLWSPSQLPICHPNTSEENHQGKKYPRKRVSATRDFPPFCGRNAPCPTEEERRRIIRGKKVLGDSEKIVESTLVTETARTAVEKLGGNEENHLNNELKENLPETKKTKAGVGGSIVKETIGDGAEESGGKVYTKRRKLEHSVPKPKTATLTITGKDYEDSELGTEGVGKEIVVYSPDNGFICETPSSGDSSERELGRVVVQGLIAAPNCPWKSGKGGFTGETPINDDSSEHEEGRIVVQGQWRSDKEASKPFMTSNMIKGEKSESARERKAHVGAYSGRKSAKKTTLGPRKATRESKHPLVVKGVGDVAVRGREDPYQRPPNFEVSVPPCPNSSSDGNARNKVREVLREFQVICRRLLRQEEAKLKQQGPGKNRIDLQAMQTIKDKGLELKIGKLVGPVPGVEVGDEFQYRVELALVGIHRIYQGGIDYVKQGKTIVATSIVDSGGYANELDSADVLIYSGQGGNVNDKKKEPEDQKLERGNLALKNSMESQNPVRVIRGSKETKASNSDARARMVSTYVYDGLYTVERYWQEKGPHGKLVFKFELKRIPGQPELAWKEVKKSNKFKVREGLRIDDISKGKEPFRICAINTVDNEGPPTFTYITKMKYPNWFHPTPQKGCDCVGGCSDSQKCSCADKNGGEIPYNYNGALVEIKPLVYECGPSCKCPPSCYNRTSQHGIKIQLEIFKTESRGWGVRSLTSIPSGSFICEYTGEILEDKDAQERENDEYLFDIGKNLCTDVEDGGFTIDAANFGNVGRFINHSCSPNLYAQDVLYDHQDKRIPHIMFFAADNIPPLQELTYDYHYKVGQVRDSNGNIRVKRCYCGSSECTGRMY